MKIKRNPIDTLNYGHYLNFLEKKQIIDRESGFIVPLENLNKHLFDWQKEIVKWAIHRGRAALFERCGLGKTAQQLEWGNQIHKKENEPILILAPLAVAEQTKGEGNKFDIPVNICKSKADVKNGINITNYEKMDKFDPNDFIGVVLDESGILKDFTGKIRNEIISKFGKIKYRLACTATPAPNDYSELGNHSEFLGIMSRSEMLSTFFINDTNNTGDWRLKGHVQDNIFWKWVASWSIMISKPSDIGFPDNKFELPKLHYHEHIIKCQEKPKNSFFVQQVRTLQERRNVRKETIDLRCSIAADLINKTNKRWIIWCGLNPESTLMTKLVNKAKEVTGSQKNEVKTERMLKFAKGKIKRLVTKPKIAGHGMNWQVCSHAAFIGLNDSWEQFYQAVRRIHRFGQKKQVHVHIFIEEREGTVLKNIKKKDDQAQKMIKNMIKYMRDFSKQNIQNSKRDFIEYCPKTLMEVPKWLQK